MRKSHFVFFLFVLFGLIVGGCRVRPPISIETTRAVPTHTSAPPLENTSTFTVESPRVEVPSLEPTFTPTVEFTVTPTIPVSNQSLISMLDCGQVFCQVAWPGFLERPIATGFRRTTDPIYPYANTKGGTLEAHHGVELVNSYGTPILAAADGEVVFAGSDELTLLGPYTHFYGNVIMLRHPGLFFGEDLFTVYAHLSVIEVAEGDLVSVGDKIGEVGASGAADGSHLHFEVRLGANDYDYTHNPTLWFAPIHPEDPTEKGSTLAGVFKDRYDDPVPQYDFVLEGLNSEGEVIHRYYPKTYVIAQLNAYPDLDENFVIPDIPPGDYRLAFIAGAVHEIFFTLEPGALGWVSIQFD